MSYQGFIAEIPVGAGGLTGNKNLAQVPADQLLDALNVTYESGTVAKEGGSAKYNSTAISGGPSVIGGWDWWPSADVQRMIVMTSDGTLYKDSGVGTFPITLKSPLTATDVVPVFVEGGKEAAAQNRKLFIFTGANVVQVLSGDGVTTSDITAPPTDWSGSNQPIAGCIHENRLWGWGNLNDPHRVYASLASDHEDFTGTPFSISVYPGEGERLVGGISYKGMLVLWKKPTGIYAIDTSAADTTAWRAVRLTGSIGIASPQGMVIVDDDILFQDTNGNFQFLSATSAFGDLASRNLSTAAYMNEWLKSRLNYSRLFNVRGIYYPTKREAHFAIAGLGNTLNTHRIVVDFNRPDYPRFRWSDKDYAQSLWLQKDSDNIPRPLYGDAIGFVWKLDQSARTKDGAGYLSQFQIPHDDFSRLDRSLLVKRKLGDFLELVGEPKGAWDISVDIIWDGVTRQTVTFNMGGAWSVLGIDTILGSWYLGGGQLLTRRKRIIGSGRRLSLLIRNSGAGQDFSIMKFLFYFRVGDEDLEA